MSLKQVRQVSPEVLGLTLTYIVTLSVVLQWTTRQTAELENAMTAVERNLEYTRLEQEPPRLVSFLARIENHSIAVAGLQMEHRTGLQAGHMLVSLSMTE